MPRYNDIKARHRFDGRADDNTKVAAIFMHAGEHNRKMDANAKLIINNPPSDLNAYDYIGAKINPSGGTLTIPFGPRPVYLTTNNLSVEQLRTLIRSAKIEGVTPVNMYALSLTQPANQKQEMIVRVQNQMPFAIEGTLTVEVVGGSGSSSADFTISEGRLKEVRIEWPGATLNSKNVYGIKMTATVKSKDGGISLGSVTRQHLINSAIIAKKTINVDGNLNDWNDITPVILDCRQCNVDIESNLTSIINDIGSGQVVVKMWVAYDDDNVYVAAEVKDPSWGNSSGSSGPGGFPQGLPGGIFTPCRFGDVLMFGFGFRPRVPNMGRELNEPWAWKGQFYDSDYLFFAYPSSAGDQFLTIWKHDTPYRRYGYQTLALAEHAKVRNGVIKMQRGIYECLIPRSEMPLFDPKQMDRCRFGFVYSNKEKASKLQWYDVKDDMDNKMQYSRGYGVFDHWNKYAAGSFVPTWVPFAPLQTQFGIQGGTPAAKGSQFYMPDETPLPAEHDVAVGSMLNQTSKTEPAIIPVTQEKLMLRKTK